MSAPSSDVRVYHISIWRYLVMWWFLGPFLLLGLGMAIFAEPNTRGAGIAIMLLMLPFLLLWHWLARRTRLTVSARGLRTSEFGGGLEIAWNEIASFRGDRGHEGFLTTEPMTGKGAENLAKNASPTGLYDEQELQLIQEHRLFPMRMFACHLRHGDLLEVLLGHAPQLKEMLGAIDAPPPPARALTPQEKRRNGILVAVVLAALAWGFVLIWKGERWQAWFFNVSYGVVDPLLAIAAAIGAWLFLRRRQWVMGVLSLLLALVMAGWTVRNWSQVGQLIQGAP